MGKFLFETQLFSDFFGGPEKDRLALFVCNEKNVIISDPRSEVPGASIRLSLLFSIVDVLSIPVNIQLVFFFQLIVLQLFLRSTNMCMLCMCVCVCACVRFHILYNKGKG